MRLVGRFVVVDVRHRLVLAALFVLGPRVVAMCYLRVIVLVAVVVGSMLELVGRAAQW